MPNIETPVAGRAAALATALSEDFVKDAIANGRRDGSGGMNLSAYFEQEDPTSEHADQSLDAFGRVLRACGIRPCSVPQYDIQASSLQEMERHPNARLLIGELVSRAYRKVAFMDKTERASFLSTDMPVGSPLQPVIYTEPRLPQLQPAISASELVAQTTGINARFYRPFYINDLDPNDPQTLRVTEGSDIPAVKLEESERSIDLHKYGRMLIATYESLRYMPIDLLAFAIQRVAIRIEADKVNSIVGILVNGDGNAGTSATSYNVSALDAAATTGTLSLRAWLAFKMKFDNPYMMTHVLGQPNAILDLRLLNMGSANVPLAQASPFFGSQEVSFINNGLADGVAAGWLAAAPANGLLGFDKRVAIERVFEIGANIQETDKWIRNQTQGLTLTETEGFAVLEKNVSKILLFQ